MPDLKALALKNVRSEATRIAGLPLIQPLTPQEIETVSRHYCPTGEFKLRPEQAFAMVQYHLYGGLFAPIPVGRGKTLISVLIASDAYSVFDKKKVILICPTNLTNQLRHTELPKYRQHISLNAPFYYLSTMPRAKRMAAARSGRPGIYVLSYSLMSTEFGGELLEAIAPEVFVGDEIQNVATYRTSGRGRRFKAAVKAFEPQLIGLSGTISKKRLTEIHFLVTRALGEDSFLPLSVNQAEEWSKAVDCDADKQGLVNLTMLDPLIKWAGEERSLIGARRALQKRMNCAPGVVPSTQEDLGASLYIKNHVMSLADRRKSNGYIELERLIKQLQGQWLTPDGDEIDNALNIWKWRYELEGFGFYNRQFWPEAETVAKRKKISEGEARDLIERSQECHAAQQLYAAELRKFIRYRGRQGLDTPMLVGKNMSLYGSRDVGSELYSLWLDWHDLKEGVIDRDKEVVRVSDFRIRQLLQVLQSVEPGGIIWYYNIGIGLWIKEALAAEDYDVVYCPSGERYNKLIEDRSNGDKWTVASIQAHHAGHNLQYHYHRSIYAQWPREAYLAEQSIGRTHRSGQEHDTVEVHTLLSSSFDRTLYSATLNDAAYAQQTLGNQQKILYADYEETPRIIPYTVMEEWGVRLDGKADLKSIFSEGE